MSRPRDTSWDKHNREARRHQQAASTHRRWVPVVEAVLMEHAGLRDRRLRVRVDRVLPVGRPMQRLQVWLTLAPDPGCDELWALDAPEHTLRLLEPEEQSALTESMTQSLSAAQPVELEVVAVRSEADPSWD